MDILHKMVRSITFRIKLKITDKKRLPIALWKITRDESRATITLRVVNIAVGVG